MEGLFTARGKALFTLLAGGVGGLATYKIYSDRQKAHNLAPLTTNLSAEEKRAALEWRAPPRHDLIAQLKKSNEGNGENKFDLLIIGGGATGSGCALDAASRGLKVAMVERDDFSAETSSKSTKLVHGGVRYLEKAIKNLDREQFDMVSEALQERSTFLRIAPHLSGQLPIMVPIYKWWMVPYFWIGTKAYDFVAGSHGLENSYFLTRSKAVEAFPMLKKESLAGAMIYYDGTQNDARTNLSLALTAIQQGAIVTNYTEVTQLIKDEHGKVAGAIVKDRLNGESFTVKAAGIINATGPFTDAIRKMDDPEAVPLVQPSVGTHVIFPGHYSPQNMGLIDPSSTDGRVIFFLPWEGNTIAGTTGNLTSFSLIVILDSPSNVSFDPKAPSRDIDFILDQIRGYLDPVIPVRKCDILAAWAGIRPLIRNPEATSTQELVRNHIVIKSASGLLTIAGGKWTTYRKMAEETIDAAIVDYNLQPKHPHSRTSHIPLIGAHDYHPSLYLKLLQQFGLETEVAQHLASSYGDRCFVVAAMEDEMTGRWPLYGKRLIPWYPYTEAEVRYAIRHEYAQTAIDILARRTRLAHLSCRAAADALPRVIEIMGEELKWSSGERKRQHTMAMQYLRSCGLDEVHEARAEFQRKQIDLYKQCYLSGFAKSANASETAQPDFTKTWPRMTMTQAIDAIEQALLKELSSSNTIKDDVNAKEKSSAICSTIDRIALAKHMDPHGLNSIGVAEYLDGIAYVKNTLFPNQE